MATNNPQNNTRSIPPGRTLADVPKGAPIPVPSGAAKPRNTNLTFRQLVTENGTKDYLLDTFKYLGSKKKKWAEPWAFFCANQSGDVNTMSAEVKKKCEKIVEELNDAHFEMQDL